MSYRRRDFIYGGDSRTAYGSCSAPPSPLSSLRSTNDIMAIELIPLPLPASADPSKFQHFGREVRGVDPANFTEEEFKEIEEALYKVLTLQSDWDHKLKPLAVA